MLKKVSVPCFTALTGHHASFGQISPVKVELQYSNQTAASQKST
jgi:hypothetical protein